MRRYLYDLNLYALRIPLRAQPHRNRRNHSLISSGLEGLVQIVAEANHSEELSTNGHWIPRAPKIRFAEDGKKTVDLFSVRNIEYSEKQDTP